MARVDRILPSVRSTKSTDRKLDSPSKSTIKKQCRNCGNEINEAFLIKHSIIPNDISKQIGLENVEVVDLCFTCNRAIHDYNAVIVSWVVRDKTNRLKAKPLIEVAKEYESAYQNFAKNKLNESYNQEIESQASAYLSKEVTAEELIDTIRNVAHGEYPINEALVPNQN